MNPPLKLGMVGGGRGAFIGAVHRAAAVLDHQFTLAAGALSSDADRARASAQDLGLPPDRSYASWREMLERERARPEGERIDAVAIVTPNATHYEIARAFVEAGFNVVLDKPMTTTLADARALVQAVERAGVVLAVTYTYSGYPMVRHAAHLVRTGELDAIRKAVVEYHQGWLTTDLERSGHKQASWRVDPAQAGAGGALGDIGTHAHHLLLSTSGLSIESLCAELTAHVPGRRLDDDAAILLRLSGGARGIISASQICAGEHNNLTLRLYGERASLRWAQETPDRLEILAASGEARVITRGMAGLAPLAASATRLPTGHPEGFIEAFATIYREAAARIRARAAGVAPPADAMPTVHDGLAGVAFIEAASRSACAGGAWTSVEPDAPRV